MYEQKYTITSIKIFARIGIIVFIYYLTYYFYVGIVHPIPGLGDSWDYHIPISQAILNGSFWHFHSKVAQQYYPGSSEAINSLLLLLHIPLTISNLLAIICLFFALWKLGTTFGLKYYTAHFFALSFCSLTVIIRWANAVSIDVWIAVFFTLSLSLLEKPKKDVGYFLQLGFVLGMLIGSKYTAWLFLFLLLAVYGKKLLAVITIKHILVFLLPFFVFGLFWYIRNYFLTANPFYPLCILSFPCKPIFSDTVLLVGRTYPYQMMNAFFSDYSVWVFSPMLFVWYFFLTKKPKIQHINQLCLLGCIGFLCYLFFPTSPQPWIMVSSLRYSYPVFIPFILSVFIVFQKYKKEEILGYVGIATSLSTLSLAFYPKIILVSLPFSFLCFWLASQFEKNK